MKKSEELFNTLVQEADRNNSIFVDTFASAHELKTLLSFMPRVAGSSVLDIGCGTGRFVIPIAKIASHVTAIDMAKESIKLLRAKAKKEHLENISASVMDFHDLPSSKKFDYVLLVNVVHHVPEVEELFEKIKQVLKKNGRVVIFECNPLNPLFIPFFIVYKQVTMHANKEYLRSNIWTLQSIIKKGGYTVTQCKKYAFLPTALYNISPFFLKMNTVLNSIPFINVFCAFHIITCKIGNHE